MPVGDNASWSTSSQRARQSSLGLPSAVASDGPSTACPPWLQPPDGTSQLCDTLPSQMCPRLLRVIPAALGRPTHPQCFRGPSSKTSNIWCCQSCGKLFSSSRGPQGGTLLPSLPPLLPSSGFLSGLTGSTPLLQRSVHSGTGVSRVPITGATAGRPVEQVCARHPKPLENSCW